jgi:hypothetical protein
MDVQILKNQSFQMMSIASGLSESTMEELFIKRMINEGLMSGDKNDCGWSLQQIAFQNKYDIFDLINVLFPEGIKNTEVMELMDSIMIWGLASEHPCPLCGCECDHEDDAGNDLWTCSNGECHFKDSNEPDFDVLQGGYDYKHDSSC